MTREHADFIAKQFLQDMNPDMWDGEGCEPTTFDEMIWEYPLTETISLEIVFTYDDSDGWCHCCDLVHRVDDSSFDMMSGYGIDSLLNITDTVMDLCRDYCNW